MTTGELVQRVGDMLTARGKLPADRWKSMTGSLNGEPAALEEEIMATLADPFLYDGCLEELVGCPAVDPVLCAVQDDFMERILQLVPYEEWLRNEAFPIRQEINTLHVTFANPLERLNMVRLQEHTGCRVQPLVCRLQCLHQAQRRYLRRDVQRREPADLRAAADEALASVNRMREKIGRGDAAAMEALMKDTAVLQFMRMLFQQFIEAGISDIHFEPQATTFRIRVRRDGVLQVVGEYPPNLACAVINRIKLMTGMHQHNTVTPQDGRIQYEISAQRQIDSRVSCMPSLFGENIVMRLLDKGRGIAALDHLGFSSAALASVTKGIEAPNGLILVTGPTGSGKSSTLYACLHHVNAPEVGVFTVEDPVEYQLAGATQVGIDEEHGRTFAAVLRALLRQDPDVIMIGEMRDSETADIAVKAALTGHLVLSTLHTNSAAGAVTRLLNMGVEPFLIASAVTVIIAQRLVRRICVECKEQVADGERRAVLRDGLALGQAPLWRGRGCPACAGTGYRGRQAVLEVLVPNDEIRQLVLQRASTDVIHRAACQAGMQTLRDAALERALHGETTLDEIIRATTE